MSAETPSIPVAAPQASRPRNAPAVPEKLRDTGLSAEAVCDLLLKILYVQGARTGQQIMDAIKLPFPLVDEQLLSLQQRRLIEVRGTSGHGRGGYIFDLGGSGRERAREALDVSQYAGPAPVPLEHYRAWVEAQSVRNVTVTRQKLLAGFSEMVLDHETFDTLGPAINSAKSLFLYGDPGNGKTVIAETIARLLGGAIYVPYAVDVDGQVMIVQDPVYHKAVKEENGAWTSESGDQPAWLRDAPDYDRRYVRVARPVVVTGGELTLDQLDLQYDHQTKMYQAPFQLKANGGVLIVDDFGRQRVPPRELLNRWIVPLEKRLDYLTLHTGSKFPVPFDCLLIFATNIDPKELVEEAFLRRIHYKIHIDSPAPEQFTEIFRRCCAARRIPFATGAVEHIYREYYQRHSIPARGCHPRDIVDHIVDAARYLEVDPTLSTELIDRACHSYFINLADAL